MRLKVRQLDELLVAVAFVVGFFTLYCDPTEPLPPGMCDSASISSPVDGSEYWEGDTIHFEFSGEDTISVLPSLRTLLQFTWTSNVDKLIGNTTSFDRNDLSAGVHTITLIVSRVRRPPLLPALLCTYTTTITVVPQDVCKGYGIIKPKDGDTFDVNDSVELLYEAPGATIESVTWESSRDDYLGSGNPFTVQGPSKGDHTITAQAQLLLSTGASVVCEDTVGINVVSVCDASISPANNATFLEGDPVVCSYAVPAGTLTYVHWTVDGQGLGVDTPFTINGLSDGEHTILAYALVITPGGLEFDCVNVVQITVEDRPIPGRTDLPDTGQERCYDEFRNVTCPQFQPNSFYGQDAQYVTHPMSFTDNGNGTVTDNVTGLVWQKEDDNNSYNWEGATNMCAALPLDGGGWRLPSRRELLSILNVGRTATSSPTIDQAYFPGTDANAYYWTSTTYASDATFAWTVRFSDGDIGYVVKSNQYNFVTRVLCVRGNAYLPSNTFSDNSDGTVTDGATGLIWQKQDDGILRTWENALSYCENLTLANYYWKLPDLKEIESIVKVTAFNPSIDTSFFSTASANPFVEPYWSSTPIVSIMGPSRYVVYFSIGSVLQEFSPLMQHTVRCVRRPPEGG